jgi:thiol-disulfide isomerase/thioredoxin
MRFIKTTMKLVGITTLVICIGFAVSKGLFTDKIIAASTVAITPGKVYEIVEISSSSEGKMTNFFFNDDKGNKHSLMDITEGKYTFLNFWGTWCPPCRHEIPAIIELQKELESEGLIVIGVAMERAENPMEAVSTFSKSRNLNYVNFTASREVVGKLAQTYNGVDAVPTTFLVNKSGEIFERIRGARSKEEFKASLDKLMQ